MIEPVPEPEMTEDGVGAGVRSRKARLQLVCCATSVVYALISEWLEFRVTEKDGVLQSRSYTIEASRREA